MKAFILAAGEGTRMRPLTSKISKALLPIAGKPFIEHMLDALKANKIIEISILVGWGAKELERHLGDGSKFGLKIRYIHQKDRLGTAHAIGYARKHMKKDAFLAINGDVVLTKEAIKTVMASYKKNKDMVITGAEVDNPCDFGIIETDKKNCLTCLHEKVKNPPTNLANAGLYLFTHEIFDAIDKTELSARGEYEVTDSIQMLAKTHRIRCVSIKDEWVDVGRPWDLLKANSILMKDLEECIEGEVQPYTTIEGPVVIGKGTIIRNGSYIIGPVIIGKNSDIGPNCYIRPSTYIGSKCKVGNATEIKNSIIMDGSKVPHHNYMGDSVVGRNCNFGSGTKVANLRLDGKNIVVNIKGQRVDTGIRKFGVIAGDDVKTGINATIDPGTIIGEKTFIGPGAIVKGIIAPGSKVY
ncbi:MAG: NTP transferase domain-containing protein [Thermoplasmata archaeon]|nr:NTP transferase domain-containing protein [Thermoplasmata archaeon]